MQDWDKPSVDDYSGLEWTEEDSQPECNCDNPGIDWLGGNYPACPVHDRDEDKTAPWGGLG